MASNVGIEANHIAYNVDAREHFTQHLVSALMDQFPDLNALIYHNTKSVLNIISGPKDLHISYSIPAEMPEGHSSKGVFEVWLLDEATFNLHGDGGYRNWAFGGDFEQDGKNVEFHSRGWSDDDDNDDWDDED